jgi:hypothetical protein
MVDKQRAMGFTADVHDICSAANWAISVRNFHSIASLQSDRANTEEQEDRHRNHC